MSFGYFGQLPLFLKYTVEHLTWKGRVLLENSTALLVSVELNQDARSCPRRIVVGLKP